jgi:hypothetical protein
VAEWVHAQKDPADELAQLHYFSFKKRQGRGGDRVCDYREGVCVEERSADALLRAGGQGNQPENCPFRPFGSGDSLLNALSECIRSIRQYPYEPDQKTMNTNQTSGPLFGWTEAIYALHALSLLTGILGCCDDCRGISHRLAIHHRGDFQLREAQ